MVDPNNLTKRYYKIGEVAKIFNVATSLIRYWENEFPQLKPLKNSSGVRRYLKEDVLLIGHIYELVKIKGYKLGGAKKALKDKNILKQIKDNSPEVTNLQSLKSELIDIRDGLKILKAKVSGLQKD